MFFAAQQLAFCTSSSNPSYSIEDRDVYTKTQRVNTEEEAGDIQHLETQLNVSPPRLFYGGKGPRAYCVHDSGLSNTFS